jgi:cellulose synthase/poly-beta-1,6-N-acetylglucosamine synthase-like glycosyltransferase
MVVSIIGVAIALLLLLPTTSDIWSALKILARGGARDRRSEDASGQRFLFLVPAHDEEMLIGDCVRSLRRLDYPADDYLVVVVADNCRDRTAEVVEEMGVECLRRTDPDNPGKPAAIKWALAQLDWQAVDAIVIVDADTEIDPSYAIAMSRRPGLRHTAVQAYNGLSNPDDSALTRMAATLSAVYYEFLYPLKAAAGLNAPLTGAGMCLGTAVLSEHGWNARSISEDIEMYVQLTLHGVRTDVAPEAKIYAQEARSLGQSYSQRKRWRRGRLVVLQEYGGRVLLSKRISLHQKLDLLSDLVMPGPATQLAVVAAAAPLIYLSGAPYTPVILVGLVCSLARYGVCTIAAISRAPQPARTLLAFLSLPGYAVWRLGVELLAVAGFRRGEWVRTRRHSNP